ncbi:MAG: MFS transporter [Rhodocyclales bacterium]|nr:MFS transporter [Rhodocyclales bacterium]
MDETPLPLARRWAFLAVAACGAVAAYLPSTGFNIAAPDIMREFQVGYDTAQLVITGYMIASTVAMLPMPTLVRRFGLRRFFLWAMTLLAVFGILSSLSQTFPTLVATRVLQGVVAGTLIPLGMMLTLRMFPAGDQGWAIGILSFVVVLAPGVFAPSVSGLLVDFGGWRLVPLMPLPFCLAGGLLGIRVLPGKPEPETRAFDWYGLALIALVTLAWPATVTAAGSGSLALVCGNALVATALSAGFYRHCSRHPAAIVHRDIFAQPTVMLGAFVSLLQSFGMFASTYLIPAFLQVAQHLSATKAGAALLPAGLALAVMFPVGGFLADRYPPPRLVLIGLALYTGGFCAIWLAAREIGYVAFMAWFFVARIGQGLLLMSLNQAAVQTLPVHRRGEAAVLLNYAQQMGGVVGVAAIAVFVEWRAQTLGGGEAAMSSALCDAFGVIALVLAASLAAALALRSAAQRSLKGR